MLDGWYCRSIANMQANEAASASNNSAPETPRTQESREEYSSDSSSSVPEPEPNYEALCSTLKNKLKCLIYENECFKDILRNNQKTLLKISRQRSFLLDRLLLHEKVDSSTSESEDTESSDDNTAYSNAEAMKGKNHDANGAQQVISTPSSLNKNVNNMKRKRAVVPKKPQNASHSHGSNAAMFSKSPALGFGLSTSDGHMTPEEVERHLQSRQSYLELLPERAPPTVPTEMFSNDPSLDSESNDVLDNSPIVEEWFD